jgi:hypothetical protein
VSALAPLAALALVTALVVTLVRRLRALEGELDGLSGVVAELSARLDAAERDAANALAQADVAESVLLDKGVADEDDLEAARARSSGPDAARSREDELH